MVTDGGSNRTIAIFWGPTNLQAEAHAARLDAPIHYVHVLGSRSGAAAAAVRYVVQSLKTWWLLARTRPQAVYVVISPVFAALAVYAYSALTRTRLVIDVHNHAIYGDRWRWSLPLVRYLARRATTSIVDQTVNEELFQSWNAPVLVLERPPFPPTTIETATLPGPDASAPSITVINRFDDDEPIEPVLGAAALCPDVDFFITGDPAAGDPDMIRSAPANVTFTGFLNGSDYWERLSTSTGIMALTTADYSLLAAAIEVMVVERPALLSRKRALTHYFTKGSVFVDHTAESIARGVSDVLENQDRLCQEMRELRNEKRKRWESVADELVALVNSRS